ncbi:TetR/AcrR family transcriptional regulator [Nocardia aurantia]|uniref:HTH tetR-type domain-containing protein n=1 Tax=Nocardia aurantia TaxID=2585199 RepID=A0A7K0DKI1_9NOCA|nr:TetR/AcrR family transcriptional regulator [Nocardia aurantia]MQY25304.1 hypothetical protein [Nocardia aurantia]
MPTRRRGANDTTTRRELLDATARIMIADGYAAASARRVAAEAGVKPALVHYYFPTMDDLFVAVLREGTEGHFGSHRRALAGPRPLHALWELAKDAERNSLMVEFFALANHRKAIRAELVAYATRFREVQLTALTFILRQYGVNIEEFPPVAVSLLLSTVTTILVMESNMDLTLGHEETIALIERYLDGLEPPVAADGGA